MITKTEKFIGGCFAYETITTTLGKIRSVFGNETYLNEDLEEKVQHEWGFVYEDNKGNIVELRLYDWKECRYLCEESEVCWHIGMDKDVPFNLKYDAVEELRKKLE